MRAFIGWLLALVPVAYIGFLLWHFAGVGGGSMQGIAEKLGPQAARHMADLAAPDDDGEIIVADPPTPPTSPIPIPPATAPA